MRLTKDEKLLLFRLMDVMTDRCPELNISEFDSDWKRALFLSIFKKLRLEIKGY